MIAETGGITGFSQDKFAIDTSAFANLQAGENFFSISQAGNNLVLTFSPVPEPGLTMAIGAGGLVLVGLFNRRRLNKFNVVRA